MLCAFMCAYSTLPVIGTGCGNTTDQLALSGVTGNGARARCGMPASLATLETAIVGGVVDDPMMTSAFDSVTKRRAFVVALVGSPPSSSTMTLSGRPAISFGTNSSALRSGTPSAAAGPAGEIEIPMVTSLVWAVADCADRTKAVAAVPAVNQAFMDSSLQIFDFNQSAIHEFRNHLFRHGCRLQTVGIIRVTADQHARLKRLDS